MNSPTETLRALSLLKPLCLSSFFPCLRLHLCSFPLYPSTGACAPLVSCPSSILFTSFCTRIWERPPLAVFVFFAGHAWVAASLWVHQWLLIIPMSCVCVQCLPSHVAMLRTHAPSRLWPGLPKEPPQANFTFIFFFIISAHSAPHDKQVVCVWNWMKPFLSGIPLRSDMTVEFMSQKYFSSTQALLYHHLCDRCFLYIFHTWASLCAQMLTDI